MVASLASFFPIRRALLTLVLVGSDSALTLPPLLRHCQCSMPRMVRREAIRSTSGESVFLLFVASTFSVSLSSHNTSFVFLFVLLRSANRLKPLFLSFLVYLSLFSLSSLKSAREKGVWGEGRSPLSLSFREGRSTLLPCPQLGERVVQVAAEGSASRSTSQDIHTRL